MERFLREAGFPYAIGYGLTETSPLVAGCGPADTRLTATGWPLTGVEVRIDAPDPATGEGEILVRGPNVMREYAKAPEITASVFTEDGWFHPEEVEAIIQQSPYVLESLVFQLDGRLAARIHLDYARLDEEFGGLPAAKARDKVAALLEELRNDVNSKVSTFARLHKVIEQTEPFEKTPTHKIKRYLYVEQ